MKNIDYTARFKLPAHTGTMWNNTDMKDTFVCRHSKYDGNRLDMSVQYHTRVLTVLVPYQYHL